MTVSIPERLIIGLDPGLGCGFAELDGLTFSAFDLTPMDACDRLERRLRLGRPTLVAAERFTFQASSSKKTRQYDALEIIGVARWLCHKYTATFVVYGAAEAAKTGSPEILRTLGWWQRGVRDHVHKAAAQVAHAFAQTHPDEFMRLLEPGII